MIQSGYGRIVRKDIGSSFIWTKVVIMNDASFCLIWFLLTFFSFLLSDLGELCYVIVCSISQRGKENKRPNSCSKQVKAN